MNINIIGTMESSGGAPTSIVAAIIFIACSLLSVVIWIVKKQFDFQEKTAEKQFEIQEKTAELIDNTLRDIGLRLERILNHLQLK